MIRALLVLSFVAASPALAQRRPYLQFGTPNSMSVLWTSSASQPNVVCYGPAPGTLTMSAGSGSGTTHEVRINGLAPDTRYYYSVGSATCPPAAAGDPSMYFRTAPVAGTPRSFRFWVVGDSGTGGSAQARVRDAMLGAVGAARPDIYLHVGDMAYSDGTTAQFTNNFFAPYADILQNTVVWPAQGNHEGHTSVSATESGPYYEAYATPRGGEAGGLPSGTESYYSFDYGNVHFIVLDSDQSGRDPGDPMIEWLEMDLAATDQQWVVSFWHHPPYTKGSHDSDTEGDLRDMREVATRVLEENGADLNLAGHSHIYERSYFVQGAYDTPTTLAGHAVDMGDGRLDGDGAYSANGDGSVYIVAGHGGTGVSGDADHPLMYFSEVANGSVVADVDGPVMTLRNIRADGMETDHVSLVKEEGLVLTAPRPAERLSAIAPTTITWISSGPTTEVRLEYSLDGTAWTVIADRTANDGNEPWTTPAAMTASAYVRITDVADAAITDTTGPFELSASSGPVTIIPMGSTWEYLDDGTDPGAAWRTATGGWMSGPAQLGYGDGDEATELRDEDPNIPSVLFRQAVNVAGRVTAARIRVLLDDAAVVWINDQEVFAHNVDDRAPGAYASASSEDNEIHMVELDLAATNPFVVGENLVAVMVKQSDEGSSDLSFDFELIIETEIMLPDGGVIVGSDGGGVRTDGAIARSDGGTTDGTDDSGCDCSASSPSGFLSLVVLLALLHRRRKRD